MEKTEGKLSEAYSKMYTLPRTKNMVELEKRENRIHELKEAKEKVAHYILKTKESVNTGWAAREGKRIAKSLEMLGMKDEAKLFTSYSRWVETPLEEDKKKAAAKKEMDMSKAGVVVMDIAW